jgi:hypothetical protein
MSFWTTRREELHMERMEDNAALANRIEIDRTDKLEAHHARMQYLREQEIKNEAFTLTLKGDEARDYNEWKCLRDKHRELVQAALMVQAMGKLIDDALESWIQLDVRCETWYKRQYVEEYIHVMYSEANRLLSPLIGKNPITTRLTTKEKTTNLVNQILGK